MSLSQESEIPDVETPDKPLDGNAGAVFFSEKNSLKTLNSIGVVVVSVPFLPLTLIA